MSKLYISRKLLFSISFLTFLIDQISKLIAVKLLGNEGSITFIPNLIQLRLTENTGAAFSIFSNSTQLLSLLSLFATISIIIWIIIKPPQSKLLSIGLAFLLGGTMGNGFDRWTQGYVYDFIELIPINFPIFNLADIAINISVACLLLDTFRKRNA